MDHRLLEIVACPLCHGKLNFDKNNNELICKFDRLAYPIRDGIPVLLETEARLVSVDEGDKQCHL
ncbi:Trm112 family protein [Thaumasiovibrio sp. DFM-14]|uniref:Trm112 family protein n=1 Tax=Thaumasiovibrio sp. DFM-14 TaxID=3384792 RepID=UPI0039A1BC1F